MVMGSLPHIIMGLSEFTMWKFLIGGMVCLVAVFLVWHSMVTFGDDE
jgi:hypothetical protein